MLPKFTDFPNLSFILEDNNFTPKCTFVREVTFEVLKHIRAV